MTRAREELYNKAVDKFIMENHSRLVDDDFALGLGFQEGVKWADKNPDESKLVFMGCRSLICYDGIERKGVVMFHPDEKED